MADAPPVVEPVIEIIGKPVVNVRNVYVASDGTPGGGVDLAVVNTAVGTAVSNAIAIEVQSRDEAIAARLATETIARDQAIATAVAVANWADIAVEAAVETVTVGAASAAASQAIATQAALDAVYTVAYAEAVSSRADFLVAFVDRYNQVRAWISPDGALHGPSAGFSLLSGVSSITDATGATVLSFPGDGVVTLAGSFGSEVGNFVTLDGVTAIKDAGGVVALTLAGDGAVGLGGGSLQLTASTRADFAMAMVGDYGEILWARFPDGTSTDIAVIEPVDPVDPAAPTTFSLAEVAQINARALGRSAMRAARINLEATSPDADYNIIIWTGQSLSDGQEGWPALTTAPQEALDLYMLGDSVYPQGLSATTWAPIGTSVLNPLKANVRDTSAGLLSDAAVAALAPGASNHGENSAIAAAITARRMWLDAHGLKNDPTRKWVVGACGVSGQSMAQLARGATPDLFNRMIDFVTKVKAIATAESKTCKVVLVGFMQGEADTIADSKTAYLAKLTQYVTDINQYVCAAITGQTRPPVFVTYQTWGNNMDGTELGVCEGQNAIAAAFPGIAFMGSPHQHVTDKGTHLDANGYRWVGCLMGRAAGRVLAHRRDHWAPEPFEILQRGREILVSVQALDPRLEVRPSYAYLVPTTLASLGFQLFDSVGNLGTASAGLVSDLVIKVTASRDPVGVVTVRYAGDTSSGTGNVFGDDASVLPLNYLYTAGTGHYTAANIAALVDKPYPAATPLVAFSRAATII